MKLKVKFNVRRTRTLITNYYANYNIINDSKVDEDTYFIVVEKFYFRNSSRASLSIVISQIDEENCIIEAVGSGGGKGMLFSFDWGAKQSFENEITGILSSNQIHFETIS
ncbi:MAG: hypothetical protein KJ847_06255 [Firmicutes bacterium]|nr:hypothetical protein [Bacillota bacterium]